MHLDQGSGLRAPQVDFHLHVFRALCSAFRSEHPLSPTSDRVSCALRLISTVTSCPRHAYARLRDRWPIMSRIVTPVNTRTFHRLQAG
jgi:hypothetical protein